MSQRTEKWLIALACIVFVVGGWWAVRLALDIGLHLQQTYR